MKAFLVYAFKEGVISISVGVLLALVFGLTFVAQYSLIGSQDPSYGPQIGALSIPGYIAPTDLCLSKPFSEKSQQFFLAENFWPEKVVSNKSLMENYYDDYRQEDRNDLQSRSGARQTPP